MDMKKILQAVDGISTRPVEGADSMARFLRVVKEAEINQPTSPVAPTAPVAPAAPQVDPAKYQVPSVDFLKKNYKHPADVISGAHPSESDPTRIGAWEGTSDFAELMMALNGSYYQARQADPNFKQPAFVKDDWELVQRMLGTPEGKEYAIANWIGLSDINDTSPDAEFNRAQHKEFEKQANAKILAQTSNVIKPGWKYDQELGMTPAQAELQAQKAKQQPAVPVQENSLSKFLSIVDKNNVSMLSEGPTDGPEYEYQLTALQQLLTTETEPWKQNLTKWRIANLQQNGVTSFKTDYSKNARGTVIPTKVVDSDAWVKANPNLLKRLPRECQPPMAIREGANPHRVALPVQMAMQHYQQPATKPQPRERLIDKYFVEAETAIIQRTEEKRALYNQYAKTIASRVLMKESAQGVSEAPIAMDPTEPNNPTIHNHQKANSMSLKNRIAQARAQLQELAELSESNSLLAWEQICKKAKGGMFMGLEQNLEQIRHGIEELVKQRRKGGTASRGIDKHIGEGKTK